MKTPPLLKGVFTGIVKNGRFRPDDMLRWKRIITGRAGLRTRVEVGPIPRHHTDTQRAYYWVAVVGALHEWSGQDKDQLHDYLKEKVLRVMLGRKLWLPLPDGNHIDSEPSTKELSVEEMNEYIRECKEFVWNKHEVIVPEIDQISMR